MTITILQLQSHLALIQECFKWSSCIIAGGAVRDTLNGKAVKDIDVFIDLCEDPGPAVDDLCARLYIDPRRGAKWAGQHEYADVKGYGGVVKGDKTGAFLVCDLLNGIEDSPTQLIFLAGDPVENVKLTFDFDLSQAWVTRHRCWTSPLYKRAVANKQITYCPGHTPNEQQKASSRERLERLKVKYQGWRFQGVIPR